MSKKREDRLLLQDILGCLEDIEAFIMGYTYEQFLQDKKTIAAVIRNLEVTGEAVRILSDATKEEMPHIPWLNLKKLCYYDL